MLTIKQITDDTENVIRGLEKKHFKDARNAIEQIITLNNKRKAAQNQLNIQEKYLTMVHNIFLNYHLFV